MPTAMVTFNGRITLPPQVRKDLGIAIGDSVDFVEIEKGRFAIHLSASSEESQKYDQDCRNAKADSSSVIHPIDNTVQ